MNYNKTIIIIHPSMAVFIGLEIESKITYPGERSYFSPPQNGYSCFQKRLTEIVQLSTRLGWNTGHFNQLVVSFEVLCLPLHTFL